MMHHYHHPCLRLGLPLPSPTLTAARLCTKRTQSSLPKSTSSSSNNPLRHLALTAPPIPTPIPTTTKPSTSTSFSIEPEVENYLRERLHIDPHLAVACNPSLLSGDGLSLIRDSHELLLSAGLSQPQISRLFYCQPLLLSHPHLIRPSLAFLRPLFPAHLLPVSLSRNPRLLLCPVRSQLSPALFFLRSQLSLPLPLTPHTALLLSADVETTLLPKVHFLQSSLGTNIPFREIRYILRKFPKLLTLNIDNTLQPKLHFLKHHMRLDPRTEIRNFPQYFAFNLENKIKRRYRILTDNGYRMSLRDMLTPSDGAFDQTILDMKLQAVDDIIRRNATSKPTR